MSQPIYSQCDGKILKDGHTMFALDIVKDLNRKSHLEEKILAMRPLPWIKCAERMPEVDINVLFVNRYGQYEILVTTNYTLGLCNNGWFTHWQPITPPESE